MTDTPVRNIASPYSYESSPLSDIEALERGALAVIVSFKNGHLSRRSSTSSFSSLFTTFSTSSLSSLADVAAAEVGMPHRIVDITYDHGLKRGGNWVSIVYRGCLCPTNHLYRSPLKHLFFPRAS